MDISDRLAALLVEVWNRLRRNWVLVAVTAIAGIVRFWELSTSPPSVWYDEIAPLTAALDQMSGRGVYYSPNIPPAYTATRLLFLHFQSILLLGHTTLAMRAPGSLYGTLVVPATYLLAGALFNRRIGLIASALVAVGPLAIQSSRVVYGAQSTTSVFYLIIACYLLYTGLTGHTRSRARVVCSAIPFGFVVGYYFTDYGRLTGLITLAALCALAIRRHGFRLAERRIRGTLLCFSITFLGIVLLIPALDAASAAQVFSAQPAFYAGSYNLLLSHGLDGITTFLARYVNYLGPQFLFFTGDTNPSQNTGLTGEFLWPSILFFYPGFILVTWKALRKSNERFSYILLLLWVLSTPVEASAFTFNNYPNSFGVIFFLPIIDIVTAIGLLYICDSASATIARIQKAHLAAREEGLRLRRRKERLMKVAALAVAIAYVVSLGGFLQAYFESHPTYTVDDPASQWGMMYGFPEVARFIMDHNLESEPIYLYPDGLFGDNMSMFDYLFFQTKTPQNYLDFYSGATISKVYVARNLSYFYAPEPTLVLAGTSIGLENLLASGLRAAPIFQVNRPDGQLALELIEVQPGLTPGSLQRMNSSYLFTSGVLFAPSRMIVPGLQNVSNSFTVSAWFKLKETQLGTGVQDSIVNTDGPTFGLGIWSKRYIDNSAAPLDLTITGHVYSDIGNWSLPGSWGRIFGSPTLAPNVTYLATLAYANSTFRLFLNGSFQGEAQLGYPLYPPPGNLLIDYSGAVSAIDVTVWNSCLTGGQIGYVFNLPPPTMSSLTAPVG